MKYFFSFKATNATFSFETISLGKRKFNISSEKLSESFIKGTKSVVSIMKFTSKLWFDQNLHWWIISLAFSVISFCYICFIYVSNTSVLQEMDDGFLISCLKYTTGKDNNVFTYNDNKIFLWIRRYFVSLGCTSSH